MRHALIGSVALHAAIIAVALERSSGPPVTRAEQERIEVISLSRPMPPAEVSPPVPPRRAPHGLQVLIAPVNIPTAVPDVDITRSATDEADFIGRGIASGFAKGVGGPSVVALPPVTTRRDDPSDEGDVELPAAMLPGQMGPAYPDPLRDAAPDGAVLVRFVLDTAGRLEPRSLDIVKSLAPAVR